jgi:nucleotide-binding universal stress UspA family protein
MSFATLLVQVDDGADARVRLAGALAERFKCALIGVAGLASLPPPPPTGDLVLGELIPGELQEIKDTLERRRKAFHAALGGSSVQAEWRGTVQYPDLLVAQEARAADLVIIGTAPGRYGPYRSVDPGAVILRAGRPVLAVPAGVEALTARHVLIGWKDTREARRAVQDALPFLHEAERVTVIEVCAPDLEGQARARVSDVREYLSRHRIKTTARVLAQDTNPAQELAGIAKKEGADLIVVGGYGHSRLGEWIFGGVTRGLLTSSPICCLFSH